MSLFPAFSRVVRARSGAAVAALALGLVALASGSLSHVRADEPVAVALRTPGAAYQQDFNTLAASGTSSVLPTGWYLAETGTNANLTYSAGTGSGNAGDTYSFGAAGSTDRALGGLLSGSLVPWIGASFVNETGAVIERIDIAYMGEMWRLGAATRIDRLDFQYSVDATSLATGTWTDVDALDFASPDTTGVAGSRDGNTLRTAISASIEGLSLAPGATLWIRWADVNASSADDGLAVDDFSLTPFAPPFSGQPVVISQVYGGGGNTGAPFTNDFVELFNRSPLPVSLTGMSIQYASATGTGNFGANSGQLVAITGTLEPGQYHLVQLGGGTTGAPLPTPDNTGTILMAAGSGKVALVDGTTTLGCNGGSTTCTPEQLARIRDLVGYGTANFFEGSGVAAALSNTTADFRRADGCTDTDDNAADFTTAAPAPRNTASPLSPCGAVAPLTANGTATPAAIVSGEPTLLRVAVGPATNPPSTGISVTADLSAIGGSPTQAFADDGAGGDAVAGDNVFSFLFVGAAFTTPAVLNLPMHVADGEGRTADTTIALTLVVATCDETASIADIQGPGLVSPVMNSIQTSQGIVTGVKTNGFFMQMGAGDGDPGTSDGIFVFTSSAPAGLGPGYLVCVTGQVQEFVPGGEPPTAPLTELASGGGQALVVQKLSVGHPLPAPVTITAADTSGAGIEARLERHEGMRVRVDELIVVAPTLRSGGVSDATGMSTSSGVFYGVVAGIARPFREPGVPARDPLPAGAPCCVPRFDENPERLRVASAGLVGMSRLDVPAGTLITGATGPLDYGFRTYTINLEPGYVAGPLPTFTPVRDPVDGEVTVASINLERFFDDQEESGSSEPKVNADAFERRLAKASMTIREVLRTPHVVGLVEIEDVTAATRLADRVNADAVAAGAPNPGYVAYVEEGLDVGGIDVGFLVQQPIVNVATIEQVGRDAMFVNPTSGATELLNDRPPLVLEASATPPGASRAFAFTVIVNHLRSLIDAELDTATGARVRAKRDAQAEFLAGYVQQRQAANPRERLLLVGDFNAFQFNDGYVDVLGTIIGRPTPPEQVIVAGDDLVWPDLANLVDLISTEERYSYSFDGSAQVLDHAVVNLPMLPWVSALEFGRSNADFPDVYRNDGTRPERLSDHDASVTYLGLGQPLLEADIVAVSREGQYIDVSFRNVGGGNLFGLVIPRLTFKTVQGNRAVTLRQPRPLEIGFLGVGHDIVVRLPVHIPGEVVRFALTMSGWYSNASTDAQHFTLSVEVGPF